MSPELTKIVSACTDLDPEIKSINGAYETIDKRAWWQNALGFLVHIITCGLIAKNPELDRTTKKITLITKDFFRSNLQPQLEQVRQVHTMLCKLEKIICQNQGSKYSEVHSLAIHSFRILQGEDVEPIEADPKEHLSSLVRRSADLAKIAGKVKELISKSSYDELISGFSEVKTSEDRFLELLYAALHYSPSSEWSVNLMQDISWPSEDMKLATLESYLQDSNSLSPPAITTLIKKWQIPPQGKWLSEQDLENSQKIQKMIQKRIDLLFLYEDYEELCATFSLIVNDELKFANLIGLLKINDMAAFIKIIPLLQTIDWPSEELKATLLSIE